MEFLLSLYGFKEGNAFGDNGAKISLGFFFGIRTVSSRDHRGCRRKRVGATEAGSERRRTAEEGGESMTKVASEGA